MYKNTNNIIDIVVKVILDSKPYSDHLIFVSLIHPAGSKRYIRLILNMRGERKITVGAGAAFQNSNHLTFSSHLNNKLLKFQVFIFYNFWDKENHLTFWKHFMEK